MMKILQFIEEIAKGKWAITYTVGAIARMIPRQFKCIENIPFINQIVVITQFFWFITKLMIFATLISWFKPQYREAGSKVALMVVVTIILFTAFWVIKNQSKVGGM